MPRRREKILWLLPRIAAGVLFTVLAVILLYRFVNPPFSNPMIVAKLTGHTIRHKWVPLERISPNLVRAVVTSEDGRFCSHWGVDWAEVGNAIDKAEDSGNGPRGASTIPMQAVKNLFLWQSRSYVRKAIEAPLAYIASFFWPKHRMIEIYLNIAEWGPGVFGAEAAARHHFGTTAARLSSWQAAHLAAALPNPHARNAGRPGPLTRRIARIMQGRVRRYGAPLDCIYPQ